MVVAPPPPRTPPSPDHALTAASTASTCRPSGPSPTRPALMVATVSRFQRAGKMPLQHRARDGVGLLQVDAPIFQLVERYPRIGHRAAHIGSRRYHAEIAIQILHLRFAMARGTEFIQHGRILRPPGYPRPGLKII